MPQTLEKVIKDNLFHERCFLCDGFLFLKSVKKVNEDLAEGIVVCPECDIKLNSKFHLIEQ